MKIKQLAAIVGLVSLNFQCSPPAPAAEIILSTRSHHFFETDTNNNNLGLHYIANNGFTIGDYYNSKFRNSFHIGYSFNLYRSINMTVGGVSGYNSSMSPYFSFNYRYPLTKQWGIVFTVGDLVVIN